MQQRETDVRSAFIEHLETLVRDQDRAALAALRRGLGKPSGIAAEMFPIVARWVARDASRAVEGAYYLVASLFAYWHQGANAPVRGKSSLGSSFRTIKDDVPGAEKRFVALLAARRDDLPDHLRHAVSLLRSKDVPIDWDQLHRDIRWWSGRDRIVQRNWARDFWGPSDVAPEEQGEEI